MRIEVHGEDGSVQVIEVASERPGWRPAPAPTPTTTEVDDMAKAKKKAQRPATTKGTQPDATETDDEQEAASDEEGEDQEIEGEGGDAETTAEPTNGATTRKPKPSGVGRVVYHFQQVSGLMTLANELTTRWLRDLPDNAAKAALTELVAKSSSICAEASSALAIARGLAEVGWQPPVSKSVPQKLAPGTPVRLASEHAATYKGAGLAPDSALAMAEDGPVRGMVWVTTASGGRCMVARAHLVAGPSTPAAMDAVADAAE